MLVQIIAIVLLACQLGSTQPIGEEKDAQVLRSDFDDKELQDGKFRYSYETTNGLAAEAVGHIKNPEAAPEDQILSIQGSYSYIDANGNPITVEYTADENGYVPREYFGQKVIRKIEAPRPVIVTPVPVPSRPVLLQAAPVPQPRPVVTFAPATTRAQPYLGQNYVVYYPNYYGQGQLAHPNYYGQGQLAHPGHYSPSLFI